MSPDRPTVSRRVGIIENLAHFVIILLCLPLTYWPAPEAPSLPVRELPSPDVSYKTSLQQILLHTVLRIDQLTYVYKWALTFNPIDDRGRGGEGGGEESTVPFSFPVLRKSPREVKY